MTRPFSLLAAAVLFASLVACGSVDPTPVSTSEGSLDGAPIGIGPGGGVFTTGCEAVCNGSGVTCGTVTDPANGQVCCCIGGCAWWGPTCLNAVANGLGGGFSPIGGGVFTAGCEDACNGQGVTCGTVMNATGQVCCCIGTCPQNAQFCAAQVSSGNWGPGVIMGF